MQAGRVNKPINTISREHFNYDASHVWTPDNALWSHWPITGILNLKQAVITGQHPLNLDKQVEFVRTDNKFCLFGIIWCYDKHFICILYFFLAPNEFTTAKREEKKRKMSMKKRKNRAERNRERKDNIQNMIQLRHTHTLPHSISSLSHILFIS